MQNKGLLGYLRIPINHAYDVCMETNHIKHQVRYIRTHDNCEHCAALINKSRNAYKTAIAKGDVVAGYQFKMMIDGVVHLGGVQRVINGQNN